MKKLILLACAALLFLAGCAQQPMSREMAYWLARNSECAAFAGLTDEASYDNSTATWYILMRGGPCHAYCVVFQNGSAAYRPMCLGAEP